MSLELMCEISDNYLKAVSIHRNFADSFKFIGLEGYGAWHELLQLDESLTQRKIKGYISKTYDMIISDKMPKSANITEPLLDGKNRKELKPEEVYKTTKTLFQLYREWEESNLCLYQKIAKEIFDSGNTSTFSFVSKIIEGVKAELDYLKDKTAELNAMDWDMSVIVDEQKTYVERYERLIHELLGESEEYHHHNSAVDSISRAKILDKYPD